MLAKLLYYAKGKHSFYNAIEYLTKRRQKAVMDKMSKRKIESQFHFQISNLHMTAAQIAQCRYLKSSMKC